MRTLTHEEVSQVSGAGGGGGDTSAFGILNISAVNGNAVKVGDVASNILNGNSILSCNELNTVVMDLIHIL